MKEIEAKARVRAGDEDRVRALCAAEFGEPAEEVKEDRYYRSADGTEFRVRNCNGVFFRTSKRTGVKDGLECNDEDEREITAEEAKRIDASRVPFFEKGKRGFVWSADVGGNRMNIELLDVRHLGYFLEVEVLVPEEAPPVAFDEARDTIRALFGRFGLADSVETRKYMEMLSGQSRQGDGK